MIRFCDFSYELKGNEEVTIKSAEDGLIIGMERFTQNVESKLDPTCDPTLVQVPQMDSYELIPIDLE